MLVCSGWATLIKDTAKLWSIVDAGRPERIPLILERSRSAPLTIENHQMGRSPEFDDAIFKESHRWESVQIQQAPEDVQGDLQRRLEGISNAPLLKDFHAIRGWRASTTPVVNIFTGQAPKLKSIRLTRLGAHYDSLSFNNIYTYLEAYGDILEDVDVVVFLRNASTLLPAPHRPSLERRQLCRTIGRTRNENSRPSQPHKLSHQRFRGR